jgi:RES domain
MNLKPHENAPTADELREQFICCRCVGEKFLSAEIDAEGRQHRCSYCESDESTYSIGQMAKRIAAVFEEHYIRTRDQPDGYEHSLLSDPEVNYEWERKGEPVIGAIASAADISEQAASDIQAVLDYDNGDFDDDNFDGETEFSGDSYYEEKGVSHRRWREEWNGFERSLKTDARFFSRKAQTLLASVFTGIDKRFSADGRPLVTTVGPGTPIDDLYRARTFQSESKLLEALCYPDRLLGPPPAREARAGRMNANGISVFYGANAPKAGIAEVRPPVGSWVATARFAITRPLLLLDLSALDDARETGSIFDRGFARRLELAAFLRTLSQRMTRAIMPDDEAFDYLGTQATADFLATENDPPLDGIIFPSVQAAHRALNFVLFHKASSVEPASTTPVCRVSPRHRPQATASVAFMSSITLLTCSILAAGTSRSLRSSSARRFSSRWSQTSPAFNSPATIQATANSS